MIDWNKMKTLKQLQEERYPVPLKVTMAQCRLALFDLHQIETDDEFFGLTDILPEAERARAKLQLRARPTVELNNPLVVGICLANEWDINELFRYASQQ